MFFPRFYFPKIISVFLVLFGIASIAFSKSDLCRKNGAVFQKNAQGSPIFLANTSEQEIPILQEDRKNSLEIFLSAIFLSAFFDFEFSRLFNSVRKSKLFQKSKFFNSFVYLRSIP